MYRFGFIIEQSLGHITHGLNLKNNIALDPTIRAEWGLPGWQHDGLAGRIPLYRGNWTLQAGLATRQILAGFQRRFQADALFFHTQITAVLSPDWLRRIPSIVSLDATPLQYDRLGQFYGHSTGPAWQENWKWRLNRDCFRLAQDIVTWSQWARDGLVDEYEVPPEKITVIPPGVNPDAWARPKPRQLRGGPVRILFVGGNLERKGGQHLLEAFRILRHRYPLELHLVTRDSVLPEPGLFLYQNMQPNSQPLKELFFQADIFCLPTQGDCLPMVLSEAGAAGLPSVSTDMAAIPEIVREGETGLLIPPGDVDALTTALERLIEDEGLRLRMGAAAVQRVHEQFDAGCNALRLLQLMKQVSGKAEPEQALP